MLETTTTDVISRYTRDGTALAVRPDGSCVFLGPQGCSVHAGRPLVCRLYPLGVVVADLEQIDKAHAIASLPNVIFTSYGDMLRVPGSAHDLFAIRAQGGDVRVVYSPLDALKIAQDNPDKEVVFFVQSGFTLAIPPPTF